MELQMEECVSRLNEEFRMYFICGRFCDDPNHSHSKVAFCISRIRALFVWYCSLYHHYCLMTCVVWYSALSLLKLKDVVQPPHSLVQRQRIVRGKNQGQIATVRLTQFKTIVHAFVAFDFLPKVILYAVYSQKRKVLV